MNYVSKQMRRGVVTHL